MNISVYDHETHYSSEEQNILWMCNKLGADIFLQKFVVCYDFSKFLHSPKILTCGHDQSLVIVAWI